MEASLDSKLLKRALGFLERVVPARPANLLYTHIGLREGGEEGLLLYASDGEMDIEVRLQEVEVRGGEGWGAGVLVPAKPLFALAGGFPEGEVRLRRSGERMGILIRQFRAEVAVASPEGFPALILPPGPGFSQKAEVEKGAFLSLVEQVRYALGREDYRAIFKGLLLEFGPEVIRAVASDGYRLALAELPLPSGVQGKPLIPQEGVDRILKILGGAEGESLEVHLGDKAIGFAIEGEALGIRLSQRLMEGQYPDYTRIVPTAWTAKVKVATKELEEALKRIGVLAERQNKRVDLSLREGEIKLEASGEYGRGKETLVASVEGTLDLSINVRYLLEALPASEEVLLEFSGKETPLLVRNPEGNYRAIFTPLRT
jgi:DNA polymerase III subunit beta